MTTLHAQPYDISATGFYFEAAEEFEQKSSALRNEHGQPVEEYELQFIDGENIDAELSKAWGINQCNFAKFFDAVDEWEDCEKNMFIIAVGECGYSFEPDSVNPTDYDVEIYHLDSMKELAEQFVDEGLYGEIPKSLQFYIDTDAMARDLAVEYNETTIAGTRLIYRCS